jgi:hypothetical protein
MNVVVAAGHGQIRKFRRQRAEYRAVGRPEQCVGPSAANVPITAMPPGASTAGITCRICGGPRRGEEVEDSAVMPTPIPARRLPRQQIRGDPGDQVGVGARRPPRFNATRRSASEGAAQRHEAADQLEGAGECTRTYIADVPGPAKPLYLAGARLLEVFPLVPLLGNVTLGVGVLSYARQLNVTVIADRGSTLDLSVFVHGLRPR